MFYSAFLVKYPNFGNALSGGVIGLTGDSLAQYIETQQKGDESHTMNYKRSAYVFGFGALTGPPAIQWFRFLEKKLGSEISVKNISKKVLVNQLIFSPFLTSFFFVYINVCNHYQEGVSSVKTHSINALKRDFFPSMIASSCYWPFIQAANFALIPLQFRSVWNSLFASAWNCYISYRGHKKDEKRIVDKE